jgi:hypothetical protein
MINDGATKQSKPVLLRHAKEKRKKRKVDERPRLVGW